MDQFNKIIADRRRLLAQSYLPVSDELTKGATEADPIGTIKKHGGVEYIKTNDGWKYHGKGTGAKAEENKESAKIGMGGGAKVDKGSVITTKKGVSGKVSTVDDKHVHIEHEVDGKKVTSKVLHEDLSENIQGGKFTHHVPADKAREATGADAELKATDPNEIKDMDGAFKQLHTYFKGDVDAEKTLKLIEPILSGNKQIRYDAGMEFNDERMLGEFQRDGRIGLNLQSPQIRDKETVYRTLMHEMVHAATVKTIATSTVLQDDFNGVLSEVRKKLGIEDYDSVASVLYKKGDISEDKYGVSNEYEMIAEVFTNPKFCELLKSIPYKKDNLLKRVFEAIASAFGGTAKKLHDAKKDSKATNLADYLMDISEKVFKPEVKKTKKGKPKETKQEVKKSEESNELEKGGNPAILGEIRIFNVGGVPIKHIKTHEGWKRIPKNAPTVGHTAEITATPSIAAEERKVDSPQAPLVDINERFQAFARFTKAVIQGSSKALIAYGSGGVGKTYTVVSQLKLAKLKPFDEETHSPAFTTAEDDSEEGRKSTDYDYVKITGKMTGPQVYKTLFQHNGKIIVFDDCDSVLRDSGSINIFKGGLDSSGDGTISWGTSTGVKDEEGGKVPNRFKFHGRVIFISNLPSAEVPQPIKSRALRVDLTMTPAQTIERLRFIAKTKEGVYSNLNFPGVKSYKPADLEAIIDYLDKHKFDTSDLNVRTVGSLLSIKQVSDQEGIDWRKDANHMIFSKSKSAEASPLYDGSEIQKARAAQIAKSFGQDAQKEVPYQDPTPKRAKEGPTQEDQDADEPEEKVQKFPSGPTDISKAFEDLGLDMEAENDLQKGEEGSKGGKVIGHTNSGKPIYDDPHHPSHAKFNGGDHECAMNLHFQKRVKIASKSNGKGFDYKRPEAYEKKMKEHDAASSYHAKKSKEIFKKKGIKGLDKALIESLRSRK